jgi:hypothetical protein
MNKLNEAAGPLASFDPLLSSLLNASAFSRKLKFPTQHSQAPAWERA